MDETGLKSLLQHLPVSWWEADRELRVIDSGGGAFDDTRTAQRFLDTVTDQWQAVDQPHVTDASQVTDHLRAADHTHAGNHWRARFDGRLFDVNWPLDPPRQDRLRGIAVEVSGEGREPAPPPAPAAPLPAAARRYDAFADLAPAAAFIRDPHGRYLWANHAYAHLYGTTPEHVIGKDVREVDAPADADRVLALDQEVLARGKPVRHTLTYHRADGATGHAAGHRFPVREGTQTCVAGIYIDISDHTRALHQRQQAEENLYALRDHSGLPCALISAGGRILQASAAAAELLQTRLSDLVGRRAHTLLAPAPELPALRRSWHALIARRSRRIQTSTVLVDGRGRQRRAQLHLTTVGRGPSRAASVWAVITHQSLAHEPHPALTASQVRILSLLAAGRSNAEIATSLRLSRQTVDYHLSRLRDLLNAPTRCALVARAYVLGILAPQSWPPRSATAGHPQSAT
ncbi:helix-turn-helix transcriptional regulator [Streptomyces endophytica]|uniref:PAS domain S-box protein n=1 Tax=Streptomyces endophytica TaxID=2991496 RepID=A0ABY6PG76_9ACTN|nr:PAS domain S-box protein [Streptomyces endophytica]UZJ32776.1 PAS domain S-box protein [Streptomyces endophytica]